MTENTSGYDGAGLKGPLYWGAGAITANLLINGLRGGCGGGWGGGYGMAGQAMQSAALAADAAKDAEIARLKSEKYSDGVSRDERDRLLMNWLKPISQEVAANQVVVGKMQSDIEHLKETQGLREKLLEQRIDGVALLAKNGIETNSMAIAGLRRVVDEITALHIPAHKVCPVPMPRFNSWTTPTAPTDAPTPA